MPSGVRYHAGKHTQSPTFGGTAIDVLVLLLTAILPIILFFLLIYVAVRLAIRHEHRNREDR